jgi:zinc/manganese transport system permease protein
MDSLLSWTYGFFIEPFASYLFLRRPLVACFAIALGCGPMGVMLVLRRMSLMGDAISHAILPGAAIGFLIAGLSIPAMSLAGFATGALVAISAGFISRKTILREDASFAAFYLLFLGIGVLLISTHGAGIDLMCVLLGTILSVNFTSLLLVSISSSLTLIIFAIIYRPLILSSYDAPFLTSVGGRPAFYQTLFLLLVVLNLVSAFQAIGTLMALGLMLLPAVAARFWAGQVWSLCVVAGVFTFVSGYAGLLLSYHSQWPSGPSIILMAGAIYIVSFIFGRYGSLTRRAHFA